MVGKCIFPSPALPFAFTLPMGKEGGPNLDFFSVRPSDHTHNPTCCIISSRGEALQQRLFLSNSTPNQNPHRSFHLGILS